MRKIACALLLLAMLAATYAPAPAACMRVGEKVALLGNMDDPDVFVWDSRFRLGAYQTGTYDAARALLPHALVIPPGTRAVVISCATGFVHPRFRSVSDDAIGVILLSGPYRGRSGWVKGQDLRRLRAR